MEFIYAICLGVVQGLTEFLPVSSSGHLILLHQWLPIGLADQMSFDVVLHLGTLVAVVWLFWSDLRQVARDWLTSFTPGQSNRGRVGWLIIIATIPAALLGALFENKIEAALRSPILVAIMLALVGGLLLWAERIGKQSRNFSELSFAESLGLGFAQALALVPGTSRSGIITIAGMWLKLKREEAIRFAFLLSVPIIAGASLKKIPTLWHEQLSSHQWLVLGVGFLSALLAGFLAIRFLLRYVQNHSLNIFAYYRFALAAIILLLSILKI
ncbi:MAG: undecaprenyl-diphosphatase UppP [Candidatus Falkowbacteria bacterium]